MSVVAGIVRDAIAAEDLELPDGLSPEKLVFGLWSLTSGAYAILFNSDSLDHLGLDEPFEIVRKHSEALLDGHRWAPLSTEFDSDELLQKIRNEVFGNE